MAHICKRSAARGRLRVCVRSPGGEAPPPMATPVRRVPRRSRRPSRPPAPSRANLRGWIALAQRHPSCAVPDAAPGGPASATGTLPRPGRGLCCRSASGAGAARPAIAVCGARRPGRAPSCVRRFSDRASRPPQRPARAPAGRRSRTVSCQRPARPAGGRRAAGRTPVARVSETPTSGCWWGRKEGRTRSEGHIGCAPIPAPMPPLHHHRLRPGAGLQARL